MYAAHTQPANRGNRSYKSLSEEQKRCKDKDTSSSIILLWSFSYKNKQLSILSILFGEIAEFVIIYHHRIKIILKVRNYCR